MQPWEQWRKCNPIIVNACHKQCADYGVGYGPAIDFVQDLFHVGHAMAMIEVLQYPGDKVILEDPLDHLV